MNPFPGHHSSVDHGPLQTSPFRQPPLPRSPRATAPQPFPAPPLSAPQQPVASATAWTSWVLKSVAWVPGQPSRAHRQPAVFWGRSKDIQACRTQDRPSSHPPEPGAPLGLMVSIEAPGPRRAGAGQLPPPAPSCGPLRPPSQLHPTLSSRTRVHPRPSPPAHLSAPGTLCSAWDFLRSWLSWEYLDLSSGTQVP